MSTRSRTLIALCTGAIIGFTGALTTTVLANRQDETARSAAALPYEGAHLLAEAFARIKRDYVDEVDDRRLLENAVRGMVAGLDPHSAFLDTQQFEEMRLSTMGSYPGVGIEVAPDGSSVKILHTIAGSPAARAGIRAGDLIAKIDGSDVGADVAGAISRMRGEAGTTVALTIRRPSTGELRDYTLERAHVEVHSVRSELLQPGYGYVRITGFSETTPQDLERAISELKHQTGHLKGLVLDLRNNPGGVLESGVAVADDFLDSGVIVTADGRTPDARFRMLATPGDLVDGAPIALLVNGGSASAAEIVAGALKDHGRAELIGHRTYGKGSVQTVMPLSRGGAVKLTTSRYFTPSGASIHGKGIMPDVLEEGPGEPPADLTNGKADEPLAGRDADVRLGLAVLKERRETAHVPPPLASRAFVP